MSSGFKEVIFNNLERAISTDINRQQKFKGADVSNLFRYMINVSAQDDLEAGGNVSPSDESASVGTPLNGEIINGLLVKPENATLRLAVDPGVLFIVDPDGSPDDSPYKYVHDAGITLLDGLVMTANSSGLTRIDFIEIQVTAAISEQDNRDVYNTITGLFTPTLLPKASQDVATIAFGQNNIRVRLGSPGAGFPGSPGPNFQSGWMPICVAIVPDGTTTNDTITFYDVRPLISDRIYQPFNLTRDNPKLSGHIDGRDPDNVTGRFYGEFNSRKVGGRLRFTAPGTSSDTIHPSTDTTNLWEPGSSMSTTVDAWAMYLVFPLGLPRWARYTDSGGGQRVPQSPRGIIVCSSTLPQYNGQPLFGITPPNVYGFAGLVENNAIAVAQVPSRFAPGNTCPWWMVNDYVGWGSDLTSATTNPSSALDTNSNSPVNFGVGGLTFSATLSNPPIPQNATSITASIKAVYHTLSGFLQDTFEFFANISDGTGNQATIPTSTLSTTLGPPSSSTSFHTYVFAGDIEIPALSAEGNAPNDINVNLDVESTSFGGNTLRDPATLITTDCLITGYRVPNW